MKVRSFAVCLLVVALAVPAAFAEENPIKPGKWQLTVQMEVPGMPFKMPPVKMNHCITQDDAKTAIPQDQKNKDCKMGEYDIDGNTISWTVECPKQKLTGKGRITYSGDTMEGEMKMNADGQEMSTKYEGKRLGECDK
jgi:hypothetical protein